jgi:hypothetical protein
MERPIFHYLEQRVQTHIFLCLLAHHLLVTIVLPTVNGPVVPIRKGTTPDREQRQIYPDPEGSFGRLTRGCAALAPGYWESSRFTAESAAGSVLAARVSSPWDGNELA